MGTTGLALALPLHLTVVDAFRQARFDAGSRPVGPRDPLVALMRVDWGRV